MTKPLLPEGLWQEIEPLLPAPKPRRFRFPGRRPLDRRKVLTGIVFVLKTGIAWDDLPPELGLGCGRTCRDYLATLQEAGVWEQLHTRILSLLNQADRLDWTLGIVDSASAKAPLGGPETGPNPTDRRKLGSKHHVLTDSQGIPVVVVLSAANTPDINRLLPLVVNVPAVGGKPGPARRRFEHLLGDRGYDSEPHRQLLRRLGIVPILARRRTANGSGLGILRWVIERTNSWLHSFGRLRRRLDRLPAMHMAFAHLACALICWRFLVTDFIFS
jgi:transposase